MMKSSMELPETASERDPLTLESMARAERYDEGHEYDEPEGDE